MANLLVLVQQSLAKFSSQKEIFVLLLDKFDDVLVTILFEIILAESGRIRQLTARVQSVSRIT